MSARRIRFAGREHQLRETHAVDTHHAEGLSWYGDGRVVLIVGKHRPRVICDVIGEDGLDAWSGRFRYTDYFPERTTEKAPHE